MRWLLFLSRLAFICGICVVAWLGLAMIRAEENDPYSSTVITIGIVMGLAVLPVTNLCYLGVLISGRKLNVRRWLVACNVLFLFVLLFYIFYLNDPYYNKKQADPAIPGTGRVLHHECPDSGIYRG